MSKKKTRYSYGWKKQKPDFRDFKFKRSVIDPATLPPSVDLRSGMPPIYDQGQLGSCTANAIGAAVEYLYMKQPSVPPFTPSRLFLYYNERVEEGTIWIDSGATLRTGLKVLNKLGICPEAEPNKSSQSYWWPYSDNQLKFRMKPKRACYKNALTHQSINYRAVPLDALTIKQILASNIPIIFGIAVYESMETAEVSRTGVIPMPNKKEKMLGGHALLMVGYTKKLPGMAVEGDKDYVIFRNSWSTAWGDKGYGYIPMEYLTNADLAADFWAVEDMEV